jgi:hypothetical protein
MVAGRPVSSILDGAFGKNAGDGELSDRNKLLLAVCGVVEIGPELAGDMISSPFISYRHERKRSSH